MYTLEITGKTIRAHHDTQTSHTYYSIDDIADVLGFERESVYKATGWTWGQSFFDNNGRTVPRVDTDALTKLILASHKPEARAHLYRRIHGVEPQTYSHGEVLYNGYDAAICLGYEDVAKVVRHYFEWRGKRLREADIHKLVVNSPLPDAEEFEEKLFDEARLTYLWQHMKFGPEQVRVIIPFVYKGVRIRTFARGEDGDFCFVLDEVCEALGVKKAPPLGRGMKMRCVVGLEYDYNYSRWEKVKACVVSETGLEQLLDRVDSTEVKEFREWVDSKILPSLKQRHPWGNGRPDRVTLK